MGKKIKLSVPVPCHENWNNMSPVEKGRFCGSCQKQVVDFSNMSDREVASFFKKPSTGSVCGRFMSEQLDREIIIPRKRVPWLKYFFQFLIPAFLITQKGLSQTKGKIKIQTEIPGKDTNTCRPTMGIIAMPEERPLTDQPVRGKIVDEDGNPVSFASIYIKGTKTGTAAAEDGSFQLKTNNDWDSLVLIISSIGFTPSEFRIRNNKDREAYRFVMKTAIREWMGEVVMVASPRIMGKISVGAVVCQSTEITNDTSQPVKVNISTTEPVSPAAVNMEAIHLFPNPVKAGSRIRIAFDQSQPGSYNVQFIDLSGRLVNETVFNMESGATLQEINVPRVVPGTYIMDIINTQSKKAYSQKVIIR